MKNHPNLLLGFSVYLSAGTKLTMPPEAEQHTAPSDNNKRKRAKCDDPSMIKITSENNKRKRATCDDRSMITITSDNNKRKRASVMIQIMVRIIKWLCFQTCVSSGSQKKATQSQRNTQQVED
ncbi:hypothetical protein ISN45_At01g024420 [Arabidopsis thaliana x Arabidopsis arenosa]|uniref:Uncharacterized protein n=1 Tax=Arabidopsis thaliana x Arabidopsis arenosa TaxID=1240361 RepID=A0A8T2GJA2_9BRAS|nr:hypothetical protein ISN45_At01g024420 [Arabidopsis thaliana x Arabidopsis arenosa]